MRKLRNMETIWQNNEREKEKLDETERKIEVELRRILDKTE